MADNRTIPDDAARPAVVSVGRRQAALSLGLIAISVMTCITVDVAARSQRIAQAMQNSQLARRQSDPHFFYRHTRAFLDEGDRLLLEDLPAADYSKGGVYYFGSSTMMYSFEQWRVPANLSKQFGNYAAGGMNQTEQRQFIRYLVDYRGLLDGGKGKTMVVLGLSFINAHGEPNNFLWHFRSLLSRSGLYDYDPDQGITPANISAVVKDFYTERARCRSFIKRLMSGPPTLTWAPLDPAEFDKEIKEVLGPNWRAAMIHQNQELATLLEYLNANNVPTVAVILPYGSWCNQAPYQEAFRDQVEGICREKSVPLIDCGRLLSDDEFFDRSHCNARGAAKIHQVLLQIGLDHLSRIGALPKPQLGKTP